jgi:hypothetical protein
MNPLARYRPSKNSDHPCPDLTMMAELELSAFFNAVTQLFGSDQAELSAQDWLQELIVVDGLPQRRIGVPLRLSAVRLRVPIAR